MKVKSIFHYGTTRPLSRSLCPIRVPPKSLQPLRCVDWGCKSHVVI